MNLFKKGIRKSLGTLESTIMEVLWKHSEPQSAREVTQLLAPKHTVSFNAVSTVLGRLEKKNIVKRIATGKRYKFTPVQSKKEYSYSIFSAGLSALLKDKTLLSAAGISGDQTESIDPETMKLLSDFLQNHDSSKKA